MATVIEVDCSTGISTEREQTAEEVAAQEQMAADNAKRQAEADAQAAQVAAAKESAHAKLAAIGLTADEIAALIK
jgi:archaellum component FlaD/FlaE